MSSCAVGITAAIERAKWGPWDEVVTVAPRSYARSVQREGGLALLLAPDDLAEAAPQRWLERIDALLLSGGSDIDPAMYGQEPHPETKAIWPERDRFEIALTRAAMEEKVPVLGICRGMELLNVALGGDLVQHLPDVIEADEHRHMPGVFGDHEVRMQPGSLAARVVGTDRTMVKSHHHQGIHALGQGLMATGWSANGDVVEAIEADQRDHPFALGVLWHPEEEERSRVVEALIDAARGKVEA
jgi:putative glutamine amidotransferase